MIVVDDHWTTKHMQILHHILLNVCQGGDLSVVALTKEQKCITLPRPFPGLFMNVHLYSTGKISSQNYLQPFCVQVRAQI